MLRASQFKHWAQRMPQVNADRLLAYIRWHILWHGGVPPSFEDMAKMMGITSKGLIHRAIRKLESEGRIRRIAGRARAIEVLEPAPLMVIDDADYYRVERMVINGRTEAVLMPLDVRESDK
jgi:SOS-response transcriptional repressor LexA